MDWVKALEYLMEHPNGIVTDQFCNEFGWMDNRLVELTSITLRDATIYMNDELEIVDK